MIEITIYTNNKIFKKNIYTRFFEMPKNIKEEREILNFISIISLPNIKKVEIINDELNNEEYSI